MAAFIKRAKAPDHLKADIEQFYQSDTDTSSSRTEDIMQDMPYYLKVKIAKHLCCNILSAVRVFHGCGQYFLDALAVHLREGFFPPSQVCCDTLRWPGQNRQKMKSLAGKHARDRQNFRSIR